MVSPKKSVKKAVRGGSGLVFPAGRVGSMLRRGRYAKRVSSAAGVYLAACLEFLVSEVIEVAAEAAKAKKGVKRITPRAVMTAVRSDEDLGTLLKDVTIAHSGVVPNLHDALHKKQKAKKAAKKAAKKTPSV